MSNSTQNDWEKDKDMPRMNNRAFDLMEIKQRLKVKEIIRSIGK